MFRLCLIAGLFLPFFSQSGAAAENEQELFKTMSALMEQASPEIENSDYLKQNHRIADLQRITPVEELYIKILIASGVDPLPLSGFERDISDILKQSFPYFGSELAFYYEKYRLILLPGLCHWSYLHFKKLNSWLKENNLRSKKILYALPERKFTETTPLISKENWALTFEPTKGSTYLLSFGGRWFSHLSWGGVNTVVGGVIASGYIVGGLIIHHDFNFSFNNGSFIVSSAIHRGNTFSVGPFYFTRYGKYSSHESGHTYQSAILGPFYLPLAGISLLYTRDTDTLFNALAGHTDEWGEIDEELKTGRSKKGEKLIKKIPLVVVKSPLDSDFETVLEILLSGEADLEMIQFLKRSGCENLEYQAFLIKTLPLKKYLQSRFFPSHRSTLERALKLYFPKTISLTCGWQEDRERKKAIYEGLLKRLETEEPLKESFWLDMTSSFLTLDQKKDLFQRLLKQIHETSRPLNYRQRLQLTSREWLPFLWSRDLVDPREYYLDLTMPPRS